MSDFKERLEEERRRFAMSGDSFPDLERRRERKRRNRRIASGVVALLIAAAGVGGGLYAFRPARGGGPAGSPTPSVGQSVSFPSGPIQFVDNDHGWMVDADGQILATTDGGHTWNLQLSGPSNITAVDMLD